MKKQCKAIDIEIFKSYVGDDPENLKNIAKLYIQEIPIQLQLVKEALFINDWETLSEHAHKMKSSLKVIGLTKISGKLYELEQLSKTGKSIERYPDIIEECEDICLIAIEDLKSLL